MCFDVRVFEDGVVCVERSMKLEFVMFICVLFVNGLSLLFRTFIFYVEYEFLNCNFEI